MLNAVPMATTKGEGVEETQWKGERSLNMSAQKPSECRGQPAGARGVG